MRKAKTYLDVIKLVFEITIKQAWTDSFVIFAVFIQPLIIALLAMYVLRERGGDYAIFVVVGSGLTGLWSSLLFVSGGSITQERWTGTLEALVGVPTPLSVIVFGKNLAFVTQSFGSMVLAYILASLLFGFPLQVASPGLFAISAGLTVVAFVSFGMVLATLFVMNPDIRRWVNGLEYPIYILCGFLFPITLLPNWSTPLSYLLAPYWSAQALHTTSSTRAALPDILFAWTMIVVFTMVNIVFSRFLFQRVIRKARTEATLGMQ